MTDRFDIGKSLMWRTAKAAHQMKGITGLGFAQGWNGWNWWNGLTPEYQDYKTLVYHLPGHKGYVKLSGLTLNDMDATFTAPKVVKGGIMDVTRQEIHIPDGVHVQRTLSHTFSKVHSIQEQFSIASETGIEGQAGGNLESHVNIAEKLSLAYQKQWGDTTTTSDTETYELGVVGPKDLVAISERATSKMAQTIIAKPDYECAVAFGGFYEDNPNELKFDTWARLCEFLRGLSPDSIGQWDTKYFGIQKYAPNARANPTPEDFMVGIDTPGDGTIEYVAHYDSVDDQSIRVEEV